jgi:anaerobic selenocysteine-containing dehydrogenase
MTSWPAGIPGYYDDLGNPPKAQYINGLMCWGQNPAVGGPSSSFERKNLANLEWLVSVDLWEHETVSFWQPKNPLDPNSECLGIPGTLTKDINTEVYMLPAAASIEKEGSISNSGRWAQWRYAAAEPPGEAMDDLSIINELGKRLIDAYKLDPPSLLADPVANLYWGPYCDGTTNTDFWGMDGSKYDDGVVDTRTGLLKANAHKVAKEINGYFTTLHPTATPGKRVNGFFNSVPSAGNLQENGQTTSGNWLYCLHYVDPGVDALAPNGNRMEKRNTIDSANNIGLYPNWSSAWPMNRRIIYNGAAVYQTGHPSVGQPLAPSKWVIAFDSGGTVARAGGDVADGYTPPGAGAPRYPFIMLSEGVGRLFGPGREDGPFPEHYEPWETVMTNHPLETLAGEIPRRRPFDTVGSVSVTSPTAFAHARPEHFEHPGNANPDYPIIGTTYRLTEHWQAGALTRNLPWLCQLMPNVFVELSEELATIQGISNGDMVEIKTKRTDYYGTTMKAVACVTKRFKPYSILVDGSMKTVHHIGAIWHFGYKGIATGDSANLLTAHIGDANTGIPESKGFICNIRKYPGGAWL